jgi:hypothetical protein
MLNHKLSYGFGFWAHWVGQGGLRQSHLRYGRIGTRPKACDAGSLIDAFHLSSAPQP